MASQPLPPGLPLDPSASYLREYAGDTLRDVAYTFMFFVVAFVSLRFYARTLSKSRIGADDLLLIPGGLCNIGICILSLVGRSHNITDDPFRLLKLTYSVAIHIGFIGRHILATNPDLEVIGFKVCGDNLNTEKLRLTVLSGIDRLSIVLRLRCSIHQNVNPSILS